MVSRRVHPMADVQPLRRTHETGAIAFGRDYMFSDAFRSLFREGMALVEDAATYLDGPGRDEARRLPRLSALAYADESMRLTTRMMQIASWLLVRRAVAEGEMSKEKATLQMARIRLVKNEHATHGADDSVLPRRLIDLINQSIRLQDRVVHADMILKNNSEEVPPPSGRNAVALQHLLIKSAFSRGTTHH